jgi:hypothetical protein
MYTSPTLVALALWLLTWTGCNTTDEAGIGLFYLWAFILGPTWIISQIVVPVMFSSAESRENPSALKSLGYAFLIGLAVLIIMIVIFFV